MSNMLIALAALLLICSLGLNVIQFGAITVLREHIRDLRALKESLTARLFRNELFHYRVHSAEEAFQEDVADANN